MSPLDVIYEDNHLLVVNKPAGLLTQPTDSSEESLEVQAKAWIKAKYQKPGNVFLGVVHRLDKPVSGIVVFAKTSKALSRLNESMRSKELQKTYLALVENGPKNEQGSLEDYLRHDDHRAHVCPQHHQDAKIARLHYKVLKRKAHISLLEIILETGRYHQIRCQCSAAGFPIVNDTKYGAKPAANFTPGEIALHHSRLSLKHPVTSSMLSLEAPNVWNE